MYVCIILGSDKTTVSIATGDVEYHPLYMSIGNVHNSVRRAHRNAVVPIGFLAIPKSELGCNSYLRCYYFFSGDRKYDNDPAFRTFKRQLYHESLAAILSSLRPAMIAPVVRQCPDGHFRRVIFGLGPFIADYPEQVMLAGIVQNWCPKWAQVFCYMMPNHLLEHFRVLDVRLYQQTWMLLVDHGLTPLRMNYCNRLETENSGMNMV